MSLSIAEIRRIIERHPLPEKYSKEQMQQWIIELGAEIANNLIESVEASEKLASKEDIKQLIELSNIRFEALQKEMNARFEALQKEMNARFEAQQKETNALRQEMNARFESMEKANAARFEALQKQIDATQKQIDGVQRQIAFMQWWFSIGGGITLLLIILKLFFPHIFPH